MPNFFECEFPRTIGYKAMGGSGFNTTVNEGKSGFESRNQNWSTARGKWSVSLTTPGEEFIENALQYIEQLHAFFLVVGGKAGGFRLKDHKDYTNGQTPSAIATGDGNTSQFQLIKNYSTGGRTYARTIWKPITSLVVDYQNNNLADTVDVFVGATKQTHNAGYVGGGTTAQYVLDQTTGLVSFNGYTNMTVSAFTKSGNYAYANYVINNGGPTPILNQFFTVSGGTNSGNRGSFQILGVSGAQIYFYNPSAATTTGDDATAIISSGTADLTQAAANSGAAKYFFDSSTGFAPTQGMRVTIPAGQFTNAGNNGTFYITSVGSGYFITNNTGGVNETPGSSKTGYTDWTPATAAAITATFEFHFPVRFDTDDLAIQIEDSFVSGGQTLISWNSIVIRELRLQNAVQG